MIKVKNSQANLITKTKNQNNHTYKIVNVGFIS